MKRNFLSASAIVLAIAVSSFTIAKTTDIYLVYDAGQENMVGSYSQTEDVLQHESGSGKINWIKIIDANDGEIDQSEFTAQFDTFNQVDPSSNLLSDESDRSGELDVKSPL